MEAKQMLKQAGYDPTNTPRHNFKIGDVVQLKSGGPAMTVTQIQPFYVQVAYFFEGARLTDSLLPPDALVKVPVPVFARSEPEDTNYTDMASAP